ncbi:MAG: thiamine-phosphate kinase [Zetaproteobacteria bacterium CG12_big_fil_rev_8_21_14_0_65_55_1124]|nr:MAG: thiamine-phosphate kinase [Zetaproteobacteria bacterium CG1_02_55_237]PIS19372.1 MAG: thiamine-phosphate kinase [Zetaproteobacteria bacterium CG08_land_8_20_14_0_20_55_17]PIW43417.1 MAG: thiamine-phosphate kinase [Zetaproteobacteria bacterium CG12_big_fil_rev_8_21_14_0_65_55_1124]PIY53613.1 MAG: thiamine-phosphate kinase [Zetaproteobacteria bacterium CG_4_10_14_0_8_um_filter_55_43]PIZ37272.1 MAG: thiamine-phosphate kinase [Zetaproteobacteria bacterium CG_4_10_14_0_2_um_filter_55_20]PJB
MSEFDLIDHAFRAKLPFKHSLTTISGGDDASVHSVPDGYELVVSTDMSLAGVHWPHNFPLEHAACRAVNAALSDLAAMGAQACWVWVCAALCDAAAAEMMGDGIATALNESGIELAGGDTVKAKDNSLAVTVAGVLPKGTAMRRDAAQDGDDIWLCGELGFAAQALRQWQQGDSCAQTMQAFSYVQPRLAEGIVLRQGGVRCCIDVSDGLLADSEHLAEASGVGMEIELSLIPSFKHLEQLLGKDDAANLVLTGGEDYALVCTAPVALRDTLLPLAVRIGRCRSGKGVRAMLDGLELNITQRGFDHFA